jgi:hypothetical protein
MKKMLLALLCLVSLSSAGSLQAWAKPNKMQAGILILALPYWRLCQKRSLDTPLKEYTLSTSDEKFFTAGNIWKLVDQGFIGQRFSPKAVTVDDVKIQHTAVDKPASGVLGKFDADVLTPIKKSLPQLGLILAILKAADGSINLDDLFRR